VIQQYPELVTEFEAIRQESEAALDEMNRAAKRMAAVGGRIVTFAHTAGKLTRVGD
jgi:hypothetical protein